MAAILPVKQQQFLKQHTGACKGRYHIGYLVILGIAGGEELKQKALSKVGRAQYQPDEMYPIGEACAIVVVGAENGITPFRFGSMAAQAFKRSQPDLFRRLDTSKILDLLAQAYSMETSYGATVRVLEQSAGRGLIERKNNPMPCEFFRGVVHGFLEIVGLKPEVKETKCQWRDDVPACLYEVSWKL